MNVVRLFRNVPLASIPKVCDVLGESRFGQKTLEEIRTDEDCFYEFLNELVQKFEV